MIGYLYTDQNGQIANNVGFTHNGKHSIEFGLYIVTKNIPLLPQKRMSEENVINKHGSYKFEDGYSDKVIDVECTLIGLDITERRQKAREIALWLSQKGKLIFDTEPDKYYMVESVNQINPEFLARYNVFTITFICQPFSYSIFSGEESYYSPDLFIDGELAQYLNNSFTNITQNTIVHISNLGTFEALPIVEIDGTATSIIIGTDVASFSLQNITQKTYVDCNNLIVYTIDVFGKKQNKLKDFAGNFIKMKPGINEISIEGTGLNVSVSFNFNNTYL